MKINKQVKINVLKVKRLYYGKVISIPVDIALAEHYRYMSDYVNRRGKVDGALSFQSWLMKGE